MRKVLCSVEEVMMWNRHAEILGVRVTCSECGHVTESFGTSDASVRRCLVLMREECEHGAGCWYEAEGGYDDPPQRYESPTGRLVPFPEFKREEPRTDFARRLRDAIRRNGAG